MKNERAIEKLLSEMLRKQDQQSVKFDSMIQTFNTGFDSILKKMDEFTTEVKGLRQDFAQFANHEERIKKLEESVFRKGA